MARGIQALIEWDVAGTTTAPVSCSEVDIPFVLNGGILSLVILVVAPQMMFQYSALRPRQHEDGKSISENVFFDISNTNFNILNAVGLITPLAMWEAHQL
ncbi:MAG: hypothetical protein R2795_12555 [Saprospiraceae bacterium]